jgi:hypothetical protein
MAMDKGNAECTSGLSKRIYDAWTGDERAGFMEGFDQNASALGSIKSLCWAVAQAVVDEIQANARVVSSDRIE